MSPQIHKYTVGKDYLVDAKLIGHDITATIAHVHMLYAIEVLTKEESNELKNHLQLLQKQVENESFAINPKIEDGHSYIELFVTEKNPELGKKMHFLRSRNDQSLVMLRLFMKEQLHIVMEQKNSLIKTINNKQNKHKNLQLPGYTHHQKAMPMMFVDWIGQFKEGLKEISPIQHELGKMIDSNPLGSGAGYGFAHQSIQPDIALTSYLLNFKSMQQNPVYAASTRGFYELYVLQQLHPIMMFASHWANDVLLFSMQETGFFSLPKTFTTGSSIMPQKNNLDVCEIMRANEAVYWSKIEQIHGLISKRTTGYQRDLQLTKQPFIEAIELVKDTLTTWELLVKNLKVDSKKIKGAMTDDLFVTHQVNDKVLSGMSFRDAYIEVKQGLEGQK